MGDCINGKKSVKLCEDTYALLCGQKGAIARKLGRTPTIDDVILVLLNRKARHMNGRKGRLPREPGFWERYY